jgi:hypothetical protein
MNTTTYTGLFIADNGHKYTLTVDCFGYMQAIILLTAEAIKLGRHYQLHSIENENGDIVYVENIIKHKWLK